MQFWAVNLGESICSEKGGSIQRFFQSYDHIGNSISRRNC
jgi:hypothetical protein